VTRKAKKRTTSDVCGRTKRLMFCAAAARKNCSRTNFILRKRKRRSPI